MKVKFLLLAALAAVSMTALAEVNNSWATDKVYFDDFSIKKGETKQVAIKFNNETPYAAAQADFKLPAGLEFVKGYDEDNFYVYDTYGCSFLNNYLSKNNTKLIPFSKFESLCKPLNENKKLCICFY